MEKVKLITANSKMECKVLSLEFKKFQSRVYSSCSKRFKLIEFWQNQVVKMEDKNNSLSEKVIQQDKKHLEILKGWKKNTAEKLIISSV